MINLFLLFFLVTGLYSTAVAQVGAPGNSGVTVYEISTFPTEGEVKGEIVSRDEETSLIEVKILTNQDSASYALENFYIGQESLIYDEEGSPGDFKALTSTKNVTIQYRLNAGNQRIVEKVWINKEG